MTFEEFQQTRLATNNLKDIDRGARGYEGFYWINGLYVYRSKLSPGKENWKSNTTGNHYWTLNIDEIERKIYDIELARGNL